MKHIISDCRSRWLQLAASSWQRALVWAAVPVTAFVFAVAPASADAAKRADPCAANATAKSCKAAKAAPAKAAPAKAAAGKGSKAAPAQAAKAVSKGRAARAEPAVAAKAAPAAGRKVTVLTRKNGRVHTETRTVERETRTAMRPRSRAERQAAQVTARESVAQVSAVARGLDDESRTTLSANTSSSEAQALRSRVAYVQDLESSDVLFSKNENVVRPIASISKLMTALVVVDANLPLDEMIEISDDDVDRVRHAPSRLTVGTRLTRADMLHLALMSSENRAAHALGRTYPGGPSAFARAMNMKAQALGMYNTHFVEPTGLSSENVSSPHDLVRLMRAASQRPLIHRYTTDTEYEIETRSGRIETFRNTNALVRNADWDIKISKTGFINEAGECLVMLTRINGRDLAIVLLGSQGKYSRIGDAVRLRRFVQNEVAMN